MKLNLKWVSETIGEDYKNWTNGAVIRIEAQTGTGKTEFIKTKLLEHAINNGKRILYICNRINLKRQMKIDVARKQNIEMNYNEFDVLDSLEEIGNITITSYQKIQYYLLNERHQLNYNDVYTRYLNFDYIVLDEAHYIVQDASFANETVFFYRDYLKQCNKNCITILVSATMDYIKEPLLEEIYADSERKIYNYTTGIDYSYINAYYFNKYEDIITTINNDNSGNKWLIFINNLNKAKEINGKIKGSKFICSEYNQYASQMDKDELDNIIINNRFECKCLIATKVIDNGININDSLLTNIVIIALDKVDFIQMLGRKRIDIKEAQNINLYIMARYKKTFSTLIYDNYNPAESLVGLWRENRNKFDRRFDTKIDELGKYKNLFYKDKDGWQLNEIGYLIMLKHKMFCEYMLKQFEEMGEDAFICEQLKWINLKYEKENWIKEVINIEKVNNLEEYLESVIGKRLYKNEQKELIDIIGLKDKLGRIQKSIRQFNAYFEANRIPYIIISKTSSRLINEGQKKSIRFWEVISIDNDLEIPQNL